jgi:hypothetical protein
MFNSITCEVAHGSESTARENPNAGGKKVVGETGMVRKNRDGYRNDHQCEKKKLGVTVRVGVV